MPKFHNLPTIGGKVVFQQIQILAAAYVGTELKSEWEIGLNSS